MLAARSVGALVAAEGVDDFGALEVIERYGTDLVQGFAIGMPSPLGPSGRLVIG